MSTSTERWHGTTVGRVRLGFGAWLVIIVATGVVVRALYVLLVIPDADIFADSLWYYQQARNLRAGLGYIDFTGQFAPAAAGEPAMATAYWPPGYPAFLVVVQAIAGDALRTSQLGGCVTGAATITITGLLGRRVAGGVIGLFGALIVALSPFLIAVDGSLMSETLYVPLVLLTLLLGQLVRERSSAPRWAALGVTIGLATLTRQSALLLLLVVVAPVAVLAHDGLRHLLPRLILGLAATALVVTPWVIRNAVRVGQPTISTVSGIGVIAAANCDETYSGDRLGYWAFRCIDPAVGQRMREADYVDFLQDRAVEYALDHKERWPLVATARVLRVWGQWNPDQQTRFEARQTRDVGWQRLAWVTSTGVLLIGLVGFWILRRQGRPIAMLVAPVAGATLVALVSYGNTRFSADARPALALGAAATLRAVWLRHRAKRVAAPIVSP
jgi:hypothetical protein